MIQIDGGCQRCGRMTQVSFDSKDWGNEPKLICSSCHSKYYSMEAVRDKKLNSLLKKEGIIKRIIRRIKGC